MKQAAKLLQALRCVPSRPICLDLFRDDEFKLLSDLLASGRIKLLGSGDGPTFVVLAEHVTTHAQRRLVQNVSHSVSRPRGSLI